VIHAYYGLIIIALLAILFIVEKKWKEADQQVDKLIAALEMLVNKLGIPQANKPEKKAPAHPGHVYWANTEGKGPQPSVN
jgi:uncharacterized protein (DUF3084 family)